jgi:ABC transporter substrate binding protein (PQQ-dependent alcohol dehydrogenase system)
MASHLARLADKAPLLFNATAADDDLRGARCDRQVFHVLPNDRMQADALAQLLAARRWSRLLVLQGPEPADKPLGEAFAQAARKFGLKVAATRPFKLSNDPRERDLGNVALLTANVEYDAVAVIDSDGEFARDVPFRTVLPRPVVGANGVTPQAWHPHFERYGAPQLSKRFRKAAKRPMSSWDWSTWMSVKAISQALTVRPDAQARDLRDVLRSPQTILDGFKGVRLNFRPWDQQLRQPVFLSYGDGIAGLAPFEGFLHQRDTLDTLGFDQPESLCKGLDR